METLIDNTLDKKQNILIADDHMIVRKGISQLLKESAENVEVHEVDNASKVLEQINQINLDLIILDITLGTDSGLELLTEIKKINPSLPILILTMHNNDQYLLDAYQKGACGYIIKDSPADHLLMGISTILKGNRFFSSEIIENLIERINQEKSVKLHLKLSKREMQVLVALASGKLTKEIAEELSLSSKTVSTYRSRVLEKLKCSNNAELVTYAINYKLV
jgi:two-component system, NarL family, invasion response regulator UvrY